jgi:hypothetical protein
VPLFAVSTVEVASTVRLVALSLVATVKTPPVVIDVPVPPPLTVQFTVWAGLLVPCTVALKVWFAPFATLAGEGLTVTLVTVAPSPVDVPPPKPSSQPVTINPNTSPNANIPQIIPFFFIYTPRGLSRRLFL